MKNWFHRIHIDNRIDEIKLEFLLNTPKIVKYYDYIHKRWRYIEVNDEVYRYFDSLKKQRKEKRKSRQRLFEESAVAFSAIEGIEESPFCEDKRVNVIKEAEDRETWSESSAKKRKRCLLTASKRI